MRCRRLASAAHIWRQWLHNRPSIGNSNTLCKAQDWPASALICLDLLPGPSTGRVMGVGYRVARQPWRARARRRAHAQMVPPPSEVRTSTSRLASCLCVVPPRLSCTHFVAISPTTVANGSTICKAREMQPATHKDGQRGTPLLGTSLVLPRKKHLAFRLSA